MKITTLIAAAAIATASTSAIAETANVTTDSGEIVMIEKNNMAALTAFLPAIALIAIAAAASGSASGT